MAVSVPGLSQSYRCLVWVLASIAASAALSAQNPPANCGDPQTCRMLALEARTRGAYETFHDLAWRAIQTGRPNDPELMYLLARAQALSGRRRDAVIMLRRMAEAGFANGAADDDDFRRVRELPEWQVVVEIANRPRPIPPSPTSAVAVTRPPTTAAIVPPPLVPTPPPPPKVVTPPPVPPPPKVVTPPPVPTAPKVVTTPPVPPAPKVVTPPALRIEPASVEEVARFSTGSFTPAGLAYDAVSKRFLFGDLAGRRLLVVGEGSDRASDLVRAESAGFDDVTAFAIDPKRGRLWVASTAAGGQGGAIHHLQLISGRALGKFLVPAESSVRLTDVALADDGTVFVLDSAAPRILVLRPGASQPTVLMPLTTLQPVSLTVDGTGRLAYVAHQGGIVRIDVPARREVPMQATKGVRLDGFEFVRLNRDVVIGSQMQADGSRGLVRLQTNRNRVTAATLIETLPADEGPRSAATIAMNDLYYLVAGPTERPDAASGFMNVRVRRVKLR